MDAQNIYELIKLVGETDLAEVHLESGEFKLKIVKRFAAPEIAATMPVPPMPMPTPVLAPQFPAAPMAPPAVPPPAAAPPPSPAPAKPSAGGNIVTIKSPMIGTFYRAPGPDKPPFVNVGDMVRVGSVLCIIEAMKLFNEIESDVEGRVVRILVDNAKPVEYEQPLFEIDTAV
jgi:acetyl-CoA carboxylase biotin carboxyl carrier protein